MGPRLRRAHPRRRTGAHGTALGRRPRLSAGHPQGDVAGVACVVRSRVALGTIVAAQLCRLRDARQHASSAVSPAATSAAPSAASEPRRDSAPVVLLAVAAGEHLRGEQVPLPRAAQQHGDVPVVEPVDQHDEPQRHVLRRDGVHAGQRHEPDAVEEGAVAAGVHGREVREQVAEVVEGRVRSPTRRGPDLVVVEPVGVGDDRPVPVVVAVDAQDLEPGGERLDLTQEVLGGEPALSQRSGQGVRRGGERDPAVGELAQQAGHQDGVARVVQLELVDADEAPGGEGLDGGQEAEGADEVGVLHERAVGGVLHADRVGQRREQVGLADAEPAVQVHRDRVSSCRASRRTAAPPRRICSAAAESRSTAAACDGCAGSGRYVANDSSAKCRGGTSSASRRSAGTTGRRWVRLAAPPEASGEVTIEQPTSQPPTG